VRIDRDAAAVVAHGDEIVGAQLDLDPGRMAGHRLVHGVVQQLGHQVVHGPLVGPADVHAGPPAHGLQALQDLDVLGRIVARSCGRRLEQVRHLTRLA
jgi:hypothetical protein